MKVVPICILASFLLLAGCDQQKSVSPKTSPTAVPETVGENASEIRPAIPSSEVVEVKEVEWVEFGPVITNQEVSGLTFDVPIQGRYRAVTKDGGLQVEVDAFANLKGLSDNIREIAKRSDLQTDNCEKLGQNIIPDIVDAGMNAENGKMKLGVTADVDVWDCQKNPVRETVCRVEPRDCVTLPGVRIECPATICYDREASPIKLKLFRERISANAFFRPEISNEGKSVTFIPEDANARPSGELSRLLDSVWMIFRGRGLTGSLQDSLSKMAGEGAFTAALPESLNSYDVKIQTTSFESSNDGVGLKMTMSGKLVLPTAPPAQAKENEK